MTLELNKIYCGDCLDLMKEIPDKSVDLVLTDPPYGINKGKVAGDESFDIFAETIPEFYRILKEGSFYLTYGSIGLIPEIMKESTNYFAFRWMSIYYVNNSMNRGGIGFNKYIPLFIFTKGEATIKKQMRDAYETSTSSQACAKRGHPYEKDIRFIRKQIEGFSSEGGTVLDPFCGSGNVVLAAKQLGRNYIGIDISDEYCQTALDKLNGTRLSDFCPLDEVPA